MGLQGFLAGSALIIVGLRIWVRRTVLKTFGWDDWFILLSALFSIGVLACFIGVILNGGGHHVTDIGVPEEWEALQHAQHVLLVVNITGVSVVKISVSLALLRFLHGRWYQIFLKSLIVFIVVFTIGTEAPLIFRCWPRYYIWALERPPGVCIPTAQFLVIANLNSSINIVTDAILVLLPIPTIINLKVNIQTKASLIGVLFIGFFATAAAIVRAVAANVPAQISDAWSLKFYVWNSSTLELLRPRSQLYDPYSQAGWKAQLRASALGLPLDQPPPPPPLPLQEDEATLAIAKTDIAVPLAISTDIESSEKRPKPTVTQWKWAQAAIIGRGVVRKAATPL
ncbi:hypothetical protein Micbo1qcDRAFT_179080 [Microdochium bolleyi]|uniref:Rhodopsin domain-containing protein n=1 Tax=Microdochium bolleyi TaxID=196109 RepID=A0A136IQI5_9PEZI|nr:hypothetical protein Micbo1qcDRAFT_179080 [Microdochium bolleyi]